MSGFPGVTLPQSIEAIIAASSVNTPVRFEMEVDDEFDLDAFLAMYNLVASCEEIE